MERPNHFLKRKPLTKPSLKVSLSYILLLSIDYHGIFVYSPTDSLSLRIQVCPKRGITLTFGGCFIPSFSLHLWPSPQAVPQLPKVVGKPQMIHSATPDLWVSWSPKKGKSENTSNIPEHTPQNCQIYGGFVKNK